jgi:NADPH:quinone reductase-like Zn-dependent oxidoreductase
MISVVKGFVLEDFDSEPRLREDLSAPEPGEGQIAVRVNASSVNPIDLAVSGGMMRDFADYRFPVILGRDFAGVVEGIGAGVDSFEAEDEVFGFAPSVDPTSTAAPGPRSPSSRPVMPPPSPPASISRAPGPRRSPL